MAKRYLINIFLLIAVLCGFSSCEEDPYYDPYEEATYDLCQAAWADKYTTNDGRECLQILTFYSDRTGRDNRTYYYLNGATQTEDIPFYWEWDNGYTDALYIEYPDRNGIWLEDIRYGYNTMRCLYDGVDVTFDAFY